jgi:hypothetical protein
MAVRSILAETDVDGNEQLREPLAQKTDSGNDGPLWIIGRGSKGILDPRGDRYAKEDDGAETFADEGFEVGNDFVNTSAVLVGERRDEGLFVVLVGDEEGEDEH